ncbi:MAG TPA: phosphopantetheine-binding protein [Stellaceae bacterium]|jgi:acyl carrier protein|nr:phosphopantetheine-binding protein [Stellaceae bacterium]
MTPTEQRVAAIFAEFIGVAIVTQDDDLFSLGGDSHHLVLIALELEYEFSIEMPVDTLGELGTVAKAAAWIDGQAKTTSGDAAPH